MKEKEKLERSGWLFLGNFLTTEMEIYTRGKIRILYVPINDTPIAYSHVSSPTRFIVISQIQLEIFCIKEIP